jgi:GDP-4-dehydro-6-deoxy-D-mannose reductase
VFICSDFARQIAQIEKGRKEPVIHVGNLEAQRDFTDVRDMVKAYWAALEKGKSGDVYNIGTGRAMTMQAILDMLLAQTDTPVKVEVDPKRLRPSDVPILLSDSSKFRRLTGWEPAIAFDRTLGDLLQYWRERI